LFQFSPALLYFTPSESYAYATLTQHILVPNSILGKIKIVNTFRFSLPLCQKHSISQQFFCSFSEWILGHCQPNAWTPLWLLRLIKRFVCSSIYWTEPNRVCIDLEICLSHINIYPNLGLALLTILQLYQVRGADRKIILLVMFWTCFSLLFMFFGVPFYVLPIFFLWIVNIFLPTGL